MDKLVTSNDCIQVFPENTEPYNQLCNVADKLNMKDDLRYFFTVENTYYDYDQDWLWTTIIAHDSNLSPAELARDPFASFQALSPKDQADILIDNKIDELVDKLANKYKINDKEVDL